MINSKTEEKIILGVDPGTQIMGYGVILVVKSKISILQYGVINLKSYSDHKVKLEKIYKRITSLIEEFSPDEMAIEEPFFGKNVQSMLKLGRAQGVAMAAALSKQIPIVEYSAKKIKQSITGNGNASKEQMAAMIIKEYKLEENPEFLDATDALGIALCHHYQQGNNKSQKVSWDKFIIQNPNRIK